MKLGKDVSSPPVPIKRLLARLDAPNQGMLPNLENSRISNRNQETILFQENLVHAWIQSGRVDAIIAVSPIVGPSNLVETVIGLVHGT